MATLREIADRASVSVATASRVLNGSGVGHPVSPAVSEIVNAVAAELGYTPSAPARALREQRSRIIGVIVSDILDPYFGEMTRAIEIEAGRLGYATVVANASRDAEQERAKFALLREHQASGIIFCGSDIEGSPGTAELAREVTAAVRQGTRVVALAPRGFESTQIVVDNRRTAQDLTSHLLALGHREIVFVGGIPGLTAAEQRIRGYVDVVREAGLVPRVIGLEGLTQEAGQRAMAGLIDAGRMPDAVLCSNDEVAIGTLAALWAARLHAPEDISVAGIGGTRVGRLFDLTTMQLPLAELGTLATAYIAAPSPAALVPDTPHSVLRHGATSAPAHRDRAEG